MSVYCTMYTYNRCITVKLSSGGIVPTNWFAGNCLWKQSCLATARMSVYCTTHISCSRVKAFRDGIVPVNWFLAKCLTQKSFEQQPVYCTMHTYSTESTVKASSGAIVPVKLLWFKRLTKTKLCEPQLVCQSIAQYKLTAVSTLSNYSAVVLYQSSQCRTNTWQKKLFYTTVVRNAHLQRC